MKRPSRLKSHKARFASRLRTLQAWMGQQHGKPAQRRSWLQIMRIVRHSRQMQLNTFHSVCYRLIPGGVIGYAYFPARGEARLRELDIHEHHGEIP